MAKKKTTKEPKGTNGYVAQINSSLREILGLKKGAPIPVQYHVLVQKTALDMMVLDRIVAELNSVDDLTTIEVGSMGQQKTTVNPLLPYYEKYSGRVTDDLYNLGLTARKQAAKTEEVSTAPDKLSNLLEDIR